jgi:ankyrin repeat protein
MTQQEDSVVEVFRLAREGPWTPMKTLLDRHPDWLTRRDDDERTVLHWAVSFNKTTSIAKCLLEYAPNIDVNISDDVSSEVTML